MIAVLLFALFKGMEDEINCPATQDFSPDVPSALQDAAANAPITGNLSHSLGQVLHQAVTKDTSSLVYNNQTSQYTPPIMTTTIPLSHPDFNHMAASHPNFNPAAVSTTTALSSTTSSSSPALSSSANAFHPTTSQQIEEGAANIGMPVTYSETSYPHPPALISLTPSSPGSSNRAFTNVPSYAYQMPSQGNTPAKPVAMLHSSIHQTSAQPSNKTTSNSPAQRRIPIKIINLSRKKDVGIQCEVGHETLQALFEEERQFSQQQSVNSDYSEIMLAEDAAAGTAFDSSDSVSKFPCEYDGCIRAYVHRKDLVRHMKVAHRISPKLLEPKVVESPAKPNLCQVGNCGKSYYHLKDLRRHQRQCHSVTITAVSPRSDEVWESAGSLRYPCDFSGCAKSYIHKKDLIRHKRMFHSDNSPHPSIPNPVMMVAAKKKDNGASDSSGSAVSSPEHVTARKRFRLDSSAEPQNSPNLPISNLQPGHSLEADLAALSASSIMDNLSVVASIVGSNQLQLPTSLFPIPSSVSGASIPASAASVLTADGDVQQLINTLPAAFASSVARVEEGEASSSVEDIHPANSYQSSQLLASISFPTSTTNSTILAQYSQSQELFSGDSVVHATDTPCAGSTGIMRVS